MKKHYIGAVYEVNQANMQNLVLQLDEANEKIKLLEKALEEINREELSSQRPGGGYSKSAKISYEALIKTCSKKQALNELTEETKRLGIKYK